MLQNHFTSKSVEQPDVTPYFLASLCPSQRHSNHTVVDKIFGGLLVSTIVCESCHNSSQMFEPFLDLSLPLAEEKPQRPRKASVAENNGNSPDAQGKEGRFRTIEDSEALIWDGN